MALSLLAVLPPLNNVQRMLETYANKYGSKVWFDPANASGDKTKSPSVITNVDMLSKIARQLDQYNIIKRNVKKSYSQRNNQNKVYCIIVLLLIIIAIVIYCFVIYMNRYEYFLTDDYLEQEEQLNGETKGGSPNDKDKDDEDDDECGFFCLLGKYPDMYKLTHLLCGSLIFFIVVFYFLYLISKLYQKSSYAYAAGKPNAHSLYHFDTRIETNTIARVINLLNNPAVINSYYHNHPHQPLSSLDSGKKVNFNISNNNHVDNCQKETQTPSNLTLDWVRDVTYVPGFDGTKLLDPYVLKKELQSYDFFGQVNRIDSGVSYLQTQLLKRNDNMYQQLHLTSELRTSINSNIISILTTSAGIVKNAGLPHLVNTKTIDNSQACTGPIPTSITVNTCFTKAMNDNTSPGAIYINGMCYDIPPSGLTINSNASENDFMVVKSGGRTKFNFAHVNIPNGITQNSCISTECTTPFCINVNGTTPSQYIGTKLDIYQIASNKGGGISATNVEVDISNDLLIASHLGITLGLTFATLKESLQSNIVNAVIAQDLSKEYSFSKTDHDYVSNSIQNIVEAQGNSFSSVSGPLTDLLTDLPKLLLQARAVSTSTANQVDYMEKYIPFERFQTKITSMDVETFITSFVFYCEEIRASSDGIFNLNSLFYDLIYNNDRLINSNIRSTSITCLIMVVSFSIISYSTWLLFKPDVGVLQEIQDQTEKLESLKTELESKKKSVANDGEDEDDDNGDDESRSRSKSKLKSKSKKDKKSGKKEDSKEETHQEGNVEKNIENIFKTPDQLKGFLKDINSNKDFKKAFSSLKTDLQNSPQYTSFINKLTKDNNIDAKVSKELLSGNINAIPDDVWKKNTDEITNALKQTLNNPIVKMATKFPKTTGFLASFASKFISKENGGDLIGIFGKLLSKYGLKLAPIVTALPNDPSKIIDIVLLLEENDLLGVIDTIPEQFVNENDKEFIKKVVHLKLLQVPGLKEAVKQLMNKNFTGIIDIVVDKLTTEQLAIIEELPSSIKGDPSFPQSILTLLNSETIDKIRKAPGFKDAILGTMNDGNNEKLFSFINGLEDETLKSKLLNLLPPGAASAAPAPAAVATPAPQVVEASPTENPQAPAPVVEAPKPTATATSGGRIMTLMEKELRRSIADVENEILALRAFTAFKVCASITIPMMLIAIIAGSTSKNNVVETYNHSIMLNNGTLLVDNASSLLALLYNDIVTNDSYSIKGGSAIFTNDATVMNHLNIDVNPWIDNSQTTDPPPSQYYQTILQNVTLNSSTNLTIDSEPNNLDTIYTNCINIIESYNKCNSLFVLSGGYPFPVIEVTIYGIVLLLTLLVIGLVMSYLKPVKSFKDIKLFNILIEKLEHGKAVAKEDMPEELLNWTHDDGILEGKFNSYMMFAAAIFFLVFGIIFTVLASKSGSSMEDILYASKLFADSKCY